MRLQFTAENLVCEVPYLPRRVEFTWYEMDADRTPAHIWRSQDPIAARVIAMTMRSARVALADNLLRELGPPATHVQFEVGDDLAAAADFAAGCRALGLTPLPADHLAVAPAGAPGLRAAAERLCGLGTEFVKVTYRAAGLRHAVAAAEVLAEWPVDAPALSVTPMGSRQGRVAAALAGSRLVYAPLVSTEDNLSAYWWRKLCADWEAPG